MPDNSEKYSGAMQDMQETIGRHRRETHLFGGSGADGHNAATYLVHTIETEILPRLMLVHKDPDSVSFKPARPPAEIGPKDVKALVDILLEQSASAGNDLIERALEDGIELETIYIHLLAPAARHMGELWDNDVRDFSDVTIGLCRLQEILRRHRLEVPDHEMTSGTNNSSILLTTACGDRHVFGLIMVAEFFRKDGWLVTIEPGTALGELKRIIAEQHYDLLGLSLARTSSVEDISGEISALRQASRNKDIKVMIGGASVARSKSIVKEVGADGYSTDASKAPQAAMKLMATARVNC